MERDSKVVMDEMMDVWESVQADVELWKEKGTKAAAGRIRKATSAMEKLGKEFRKLSIAEGKE